MKRMIITALVIGVIVMAVMVARSFDVVETLRRMHGR